MSTRVILRFLLLLLTVIVLADAVFVLASLVQEARQEYFVVWQWENLGWVVGVAQSFVIGLAYVAVTVFNFRVNPNFSMRKENVIAFIVVLANVYSVIVLWRIVESLFFLQRTLEAYAHIFMAAHLAAVGIIAMFVIAINKEEEKIAGPQSPDDVIELLK